MRDFGSGYGLFGRLGQAFLCKIAEVAVQSDLGYVLVLNRLGLD